MGIPRFYREFLQALRNPFILRRGVPQYVSSLLLDMNSMLHDVAQRVWAYGDFYNEERQARQRNRGFETVYREDYEPALFSELVSIVNMVNPKEMLVLAIDGTAPLAKIWQQRQRRYRSMLERSGSTPFDPNAITPGTDFMFLVDNSIRSWISQNILGFGIHMVYSSHLVPSEGEHKIMDLMRDGTIGGSGAHVIYGLDADLVMLGLLAPLDNIFLVRRDISNSVSIEDLKNYLREHLGGLSATAPPAMIEADRSVHDFVVMLFLLGNDFLPHMLAFHDMGASIQLMLNTYRQLGLPLTNEQGLVWNNMRQFLIALAGHEQPLMDELAQTPIANPLMILEDSMLGWRVDFNSFRNRWYSRIFGRLEVEGMSGMNNLRNQVPQPPQISSQQIGSLIALYLTGLAWIYDYYTKGLETITWYYQYPYAEAPLLVDLAAAIPENFVLDTHQRREEEGTLTFTPLHQLITVIPPTSKDLIPEQIRHWMTLDSPLADLFITSFVFDREGTNNEWQGVSRLPPINVSRIVNTMSIEPEVLEPYLPGTHLVYRIPEEVLNTIHMRERLYTTYLQRDDPRVQGGRGRSRGRGQEHRRGGDRSFQGGRGRNDRNQGGRGNRGGRGGGRGRGNFGDNQGQDKNYQGNRPSGGNRGRGNQSR